MSETPSPQPPKSSSSSSPSSPSASPEATPESKKARLGYAWYIVGVLTFIYVFSFLDRTILNLLVIPIQADLQISDTLMSYLMGFMFAVFYTFFGLPIGRLADTTNRTWIIAGGLFLWNLMTAGCGLAQRYAHLLVLRMGVGVGEATLGPSAYSIITDLFPRDRLATALSVYSAAIYIGSGIALVLGGVVSSFAENYDEIVLPLFGTVRPWQLVFIIIGLLGFIPLMLLLLTVREPPRKGVRTTKDASGKLKIVQVPFLDVLRYMRRNLKTMMCHNLGFALLGVSGYGAGAWAPAFMMRTHDWSVAKVGLLLGINGAITGTIGILAGGMFTDWLRRRGTRDANMRAGLIAAVGWLPFGIAVYLAPSGTMAFLMMIPAVFFGGFPTGAAPAGVQELMPNAMRGQASAIYLFVANLIGMGAGPTLVAWTTDLVFKDQMLLQYSLLTVTVTAHIAACTFFWFGLKPYRKSLDRLKEWSDENI